MPAFNKWLAKLVKLSAFVSFYKLIPAQHCYQNEFYFTLTAYFWPQASPSGELSMSRHLS